MAKNNNLGDFLKGIADKFRSKLGTADTINPQNFEDKIDAVYDAAAQKAYDDFWDTFQKNGSRTDYQYAFSSPGWINDNFKPKYNIVSWFGSSACMFRGSGISGSLKEILQNLGITLSFIQGPGRAYGAADIFSWTQFTELPVIDLSLANGENCLFRTFSACTKLHTIEKLIMPDSCPSYGTQTFETDYSLKNIDFGGTIKYTLSFQWNPLTADSMKNIFDHLDTAEYGETRTITVKTGTKTAYDEKYGDWDAKAAEFAAHSWTFALV
ncbi:MAG: hypothetical protein SPL89_06240 [Clostridia bacterium]|nr:hypothetical protein [Clostridia bacterium]